MKTHKRADYHGPDNYLGPDTVNGTRVGENAERIAPSLSSERRAKGHSLSRQARGNVASLSVRLTLGTFQADFRIPFAPCNRAVVVSY